MKVILIILFFILGFIVGYKLRTYVFACELHNMSEKNFNDFFKAIERIRKEELEENDN